MILENIISINVYFIEYTVRRRGMLLLPDKNEIKCADYQFLASTMLNPTRVTLYCTHMITKTNRVEDGEV